jgi:hypothetical protein
MTSIKRKEHDRAIKKITNAENIDIKRKNGKHNDKIKIYHKGKFWSYTHRSHGSKEIRNSLIAKIAHELHDIGESFYVELAKCTKSTEDFEKEKLER